MSLPLDIRFTDPAAPLFIDIEGDSSETLFVISTSQVHGTAAGASSNQARQPQLNDKKRQRDDNTPETARIKKPMRAVQRADPVSVARADLGSRSQSRVPGPMVLPSVSRLPSSQTFSHDVRNGTMAHPSFIPPANPSFSHTQHSREPLFLPGSSQLSVADEEAIRASGLGIESMDAEELQAMLEGDGEEVAFDFASQRSANADYKMPDRGRGDGDSFGTGTMYKEGPDDPDSFELLVDETELAPTQSQNSAVQSKVGLILRILIIL
jgi:cell cycle checkpoint control protein RAD9A